jgi:uroporphyrinogen decarboxylase
MVSNDDRYPFLMACRRQPTKYTPVWFMRQAGRYQKEYRELRKKYSFLEMCKTPELAAEVTLLPVRQIPVDAAIIFADILLPLEPMGIEFEFAKNEGPVFRQPIRDIDQIERLRVIEPDGELSFVMEAIRLVRRELDGKVPLIGFAGAPFTLASYVIEGGHSNNYIFTKGMMYQNPEAWHALMDKLADVLIRYLKGQIRAGAQALQLFDSWVGCLGPQDYDTYVLPYSRKVIEAIHGEVPVIHFATCSSTLLRGMKRAGGDVIGVDWRVDLGEAWRHIGHDVGIQGNLDPVVLLGPIDLMVGEARRVLEKAENRAGHVFNLGHGILPGTPVEHVIKLAEVVHEYSSR